VSRTTYSLLYAVISTTYGTGDGSTTFNLPDFINRSPVGVGTGTVTASGSNADVDTTADTLTVASNNTKWITGMAVAFALSSGTITGLTSGNTYYVIRDSATTVQLASSLANAQNGTAVNMTAKSSPVWTITHTFTARTLAESGGQESHAVSSTEQLAHTHVMQEMKNAAGTTSSTFARGDNSANLATGLTNSTGGNAAMNVMNPFLATNYIIFAGA
jgi:microcystin-dependent protein